jgi:hypothetical protein
VSPTTFEEVRRAAGREIADAEDWLRSDWSDQPSARQIEALRQVRRRLAEAHDLIDTMAARSLDKAGR